MGGHFEKSPLNPILPAVPHTWMESQTANPDLLRRKYYLWYEGYGGGDSRDKEYGSYLQGARSQIGLATLEAKVFFVPANANRVNDAVGVAH